MPNDPRSSGKKSQAALQILRSSVRLTMKDFDVPSLRAQAPTSRRLVAVVPIAAS
jgi:tRNA threonylcarbamoyladenosine modification (KEOPS) complex  Pcc1 subunit